VRRIPIRLRLTLVFATVTAVILFVLAIVLHAVFQADLTQAIDMELRSRAQVVRAAIDRQDPAVVLAGGNLVDPDEAFAQVLSIRGLIIQSTSGVAAAPMLTSAEIRSLPVRPVFLTTRAAGVDDPVRLLAIPVTVAGDRAVMVVGSTLGDRNEALARLWVLLGVFGAAALAIVAAGGWWIVGSALRPVERMRVEAGAISEDDLNRRLQIPPADDGLARLATTLNALLARLEDAFRRKGEFLDRASHELRTPLSVLKMELELVAHDTAGREELMEALRNASAETDRLALLADDLLALARVRDGRLPVRRTAVDVADLVRSVCAAHATRALAAGSPITCSTAECIADLDPSRVRQAVENLLDNAIVHAGGSRIEVLVGADPGEVRITVRDHGRGFPADILTPSPSHAAERPTLGLGLEIARAIAQAHGGRLELANEPDGGASATLAFRMVGRQGDEAIERPAPEGRESVRPRSPGSTGAS
jgi:signal transduction histidine kinase